MCSLNDNIRQFVISKRPANAIECAEFADLYWEISKIGREAERKNASQRNVGTHAENVMRSRPSVGPNRPFERPFRANGQNVQGNGGKLKPLHQQNMSRFEPPNSATYRPQMQGGPSNTRGAFFANEKNTLNASNAYQYDGILDVDCDNDACFTSDIVDDDSEFIVPVYVNGVRCKALRDSGNFGPVIVDKSLVSEQRINYSDTVKCTCAFDGGKLKSIPPLPPCNVRNSFSELNTDALSLLSAFFAICNCAFH